MHLIPGPLAARDSAFIKSELDFGTFVWSAWGARLLSDFGYGTIAATLGGSDYRRVEFIDNNPAGHNTVVVNEGACATGSSPSILACLSPERCSLLEGC